MNTNKKIMGIVIGSLFLLTTFSGCMQQTKPGTGVIIIPSVTAGVSDNPKDTIASFYSSNEITINVNSPQYDLPLAESQIVNYNTITSWYTLNVNQKELLEKNGFVVGPYQGNEDDIVSPYKSLKEHDIPIFVTTDTLLHLYHIQFDQILKGIEEREFFDIILNMSKALFDQSQQDYVTYTGDIKEAAERNIGFFAVALSLLQTPTEGYNGSENLRIVEFTVPSYLNENVTTELTHISAQDGFHDSSLFKYREDYSQYKPRGHYTQSEKLKRYFKAMMWYGRMSFLMKGGDPHGPEAEFIVSAEDAKIQTIQASLIATALPILTVQEVNLTTLWDRIYAVTSFFVGTADDLTPYEYINCIQQVFGTTFNGADLLDDEKLLELKVKLIQLRSPQIYGGTGEAAIPQSGNEPITAENLNKVLEKTKGMRLMGQRYIPDSYMFQQLVFPAVGLYTGSEQPFTMKNRLRCFPRGLDVMAVLGSERAYQILKQEGDTTYQNYSEQLSLLKENFSSFNNSQWNRNLYFSWMYTLKALIQNYDDRYPTFMNTTAWLDKELQAALSSWAELRHDTILYAKQSYTMKTVSVRPQEKPVVGYVEPVPEFYSRILALTTMTRTGLTSLNVLNQTEINRLNSLERILNRLLNISKDELEGKELTEDDYSFIRNFGEQLDSVVTGVNDQGKQTTMIADVHTDTNYPQEVLEEGTGYVNLLIVAYMVPDGRIIAGAGPAFSYYEFKHPISDRLTDEQWKEQLENGQQPDRPSWIRSFFAE